MSFQQRFGRCSTHFRRNHAGEIVFQRNNIDGGNSIVLNNKLQSAQKPLIFLPLPMKIYTNYHLLQYKGIGMDLVRLKHHLVVKLLPKKNLSLGEH